MVSFKGPGFGFNPFKCVIKPWQGLSKLLSEMGPWTHLMTGEMLAEKSRHRCKRDKCASTWLSIMLSF